MLNQEQESQKNYHEVSSDEATKQGLKHAREAGEAYQKMVKYFIANVAKDGDLLEVDDYKVGLAVEDPEPLYHFLNGELQLKQPHEGDNAHIEVVVTDRGDGRFLPYMKVEATLLKEDEEVGTYELPFLWHPTMYHYGANVQLPEEGEYKVRLSIEAPLFPRHDKVNGKRYERPCSVEFTLNV